MNNLQGIFGLFIVLAITLTMGLQFANFKEGFDSKDRKDKEDKNNKKDKNDNNDKDLPVHTKKSNSMAKQSVYDDMTPSY